MFSWLREISIRSKKSNDCMQTRNSYGIENTKKLGLPTRSEEDSEDPVMVKQW